MKKTFSLLILMFATITSLFAQNDLPVQMADGLNRDGKIYVVVAVVVLILVGLFIYLVRLDRRIGRMERENRR